MCCNSDQLMKTTVVKPGAEVTGDLTSPGALRFERQGGAMQGSPAMAFEDGILALHYADGATVYVKH